MFIPGFKQQFMNENKVIAFFDFDGTITNRDIFWDYLFFRLKNGLSPLKLLQSVPHFFLYLIKILNNEKAKQLIFSRLFKGESVAFFCSTVKKYLDKNLQFRLKKDAIERITWHKSNHHTVCIVSANFDLILNTVAKEMQVDLLSTQVESKGDILTGYFKTPNCYGKEKVNRIRNKYPNLNSYKQIFAYGDSKGDIEMLDLASEKFYCFFKK